MSESGEEKPHAPTERRLREAAAKGEVRRSSDLPRAAVVVLATAICLQAAISIATGLSAFCSSALQQAGSGDATLASGWLQQLVQHFMPLLVLIAGMAAASSLASGGWIFALHPLLPDLSKFSPAHGLGQIFSRSGFAETGKSILKFLVIGGASLQALDSHQAAFTALAAGIKPDPAALATSCLNILTSICVAVFALAGVDMALQFWLHRHKLRMSDSEVRREAKEAGGNPHVKQRQRSIARRMAKARQMRRISEASVVVTNPTHYAVAIRYRRGTDHAPLLLAKGAGIVAAEIISRARGLGIPVVEAPPLARAVYRHVEPGEQVPVALYRACAEILAYIWKMQLWRSNGGVRPIPPKPQNKELIIEPWRNEARI